MTMPEPLSPLTFPEIGSLPSGSWIEVRLAPITDSAWRSYHGHLGDAYGSALAGPVAGAVLRGDPVVMQTDGDSNAEGVLSLRTFDAGGCQHTNLRAANIDSASYIGPATEAEVGALAFELVPNGGAVVRGCYLSPEQVAELALELREHVRRSLPAVTAAPRA